MDSGYYAACAGLAAQTQALELVAHNLANLGTAGYRAEQATFRSMVAGAGAVSNPLNAAVNDFGVLGGSRVDRSPGSLTATGNPLDLGITGAGFFVIAEAGGVAYTRNGGFHLTAAGQLVTAQGDPVLDDQGKPVVLPAGQVAVSADATVSVDGNVTAKLGLAEFSPETSLRALGDTLYAAPAGSALAPAASSVKQGMLEESNVSAVESVVELINVQRSAEMMQRALSLFDSQLDQTAVQDLPKV